MQRSSVLLPEPERPMIATTWPRLDRERDALQDLDGAEALVDVLNDDGRH